MTERKCGDQLVMGIEESIGANHEPAGSQGANICKDLISNSCSVLARRIWS
jgi:hypothetical protein